jgi:hypothetical protein
MKLTIMRLLEPRPANVPADALIFNAPRPLCGHTHWQGEFRHGIFYVAIFPADQYAEGLIRETVGLDGWLCAYIADETIRSYAEATAKEYDTTVEEHEWNMWVDSYMSRYGTEETDLEEFLQKKLLGQAK